MIETIYPLPAPVEVGQPFTLSEEGFVMAGEVVDCYPALYEEVGTELVPASVTEFIAEVDFPSKQYRKLELLRSQR